MQILVYVLNMATYDDINVEILSPIWQKLKILKLIIYPLLVSTEKGEKEVGMKENEEILRFFSVWMWEENRRERKY